MPLLHWANTYAKWVLASGLVIAVALPGLAQFLSGHLTLLICLIMFLGAVRLRPDQFASLAQNRGQSIGIVLIMQLGLPIMIAGLFLYIGFEDHLLVQTAILLFAAPVIVSSPNFAAIMGLDIAASMRLLIWSTLLLPLTCIPAFILLMGQADIGQVIMASMRLLGIIALSGGLGLLVRWLFLRGLGPEGEAGLGGVSAIALAVFVISLMPEIAAQSVKAPLVLLGWIGLAFLLNFAGQLGAYYLSRDKHDHGFAGALGIAGGNRNLALFFAALPAEFTEPFIVFLAAYQLPMYLTPMLLAWLYAPPKGQVAKR